MIPGYVLPPEESIEDHRLHPNDDIEALLVPWFQQWPRDFFAEWNQAVFPHDPSELSPRSNPKCSSLNIILHHCNSVSL
jgi:hypothetical protein